MPISGHCEKGPSKNRISNAVQFVGLLGFDTDVSGIKAQDVPFRGTWSTREKSGSFKGTGEGKSYPWDIFIGQRVWLLMGCGMESFIVLYLVPKFDMFLFCIPLRMVHCMGLISNGCIIFYKKYIFKEKKVLILIHFKKVKTSWEKIPPLKANVFYLTVLYIFHLFTFLFFQMLKVTFYVRGTYVNGTYVVLL